MKAESNDPVLASQALSFYRQLYEVEERGKSVDLTTLAELRQREAMPIWDRMRLWLESEPVRRAVPQTAIGGALGYLRNHWSGADGLLERRLHLFTGSELGHAAYLPSPIYQRAKGDLSHGHASN